MTGIRGVWLLLAIFLAVSRAALAANAGTIIYAAGNCFVIKTEKGVTLFERSGGVTAKLEQKVRGVLDDFGYQQLRDTHGKDLMVGFVQEYGVTKEANIAAFKKVCR